MKELSELKNEFYEVMYKYEKSFSEKGVMADLTAWQTAKADLISLLRCHPDWNETEQAIIFSAVSNWKIFAQRCTPPCQAIAVPSRKKIWRSCASAAEYAAPAIKRPAALSENSAESSASIAMIGTTLFLRSWLMP